MTASVGSPAHPSDAPSRRPSAAPQSSSSSTRNTISQVGPHHRLTSTADYASILPPAGSWSPGPDAKMFSRTSGKSSPATAHSKQPQNQSGSNRAAQASPSSNSKTTASRCESLPSAYSAIQNRSSS